MKLRGIIDEKFGLPGNAGREFGEKFMRELIGTGKLAELWTAFEATYPELQPELQATFAKTNDLLKYIKPEKGDEAYRVSSMPEAAAQELDNLLHDVLETLEFVSSQNEKPSIEMVKSVVKDFDNTFSDMLAIFTSNTAGDKPLEPYKQTNIGFKEQIREVIRKSIAECWKTHKQVGMKKKGDKTVPNCVPKNEEKIKSQPFPAVGEAKTKPAKGKRFAKKVKNPKTGRTRTVSYGQKGKAKKGGDRIQPGTKKGHAYCARSAKIKKCKTPPCANALSRKKWKCKGSRSVPE